MNSENFMNVSDITINSETIDIQFQMDSSLYCLKHISINANLLSNIRFYERNIWNYVLDSKIGTKV